MEAKTDTEIRLYRPGDEENIVSLLTKTFPKWAKFPDPLRIWKWKYIDAPLRSLILVAIVDDKIIGCTHTIVFNGKVGSEVVTLSWNDDLAVDVDYRGQGIWGELMELKNEYEKNVAVTKYDYQTTSNPIVKNSWDKSHRGSRFPFKVTRMVRIHNIDLHLKMRPIKNALLVKYGYSSLKIMNKTTSILTSTYKRDKDFTIIQVPEFDESVDSFWEKIKDDYNFILEKKHTYLNWRFSKNGRGNHIILQAKNQEEILGYLVLGLLEDGGYSEGQIEDLIALKKRKDVAEALLDYACNHFDDQGINTVYYQVVEDHKYQKLSEKKGFINSHSNPYIFFDYSVKDILENESPFPKNTTPSQVYFNYAETV